MLSLKTITGLLSVLLLLVLPAVTAHALEKPGNCPIIASDSGGGCPETCVDDFDCPGDEKCCLLSGQCPLTCLPPVFDTCCYGNLTFEHGDLVDSFPTKCMQLYCNDGDIVDRYYDKPEDCGCCEFNGKMYKDGERIAAVCTDMTCNYGKWETRGWFDECCSRCNLKNDPHITTFDQWYYDWHGTCNYSISQKHYGYHEEFGIYGKFRPCNRKASCIEITTFTDNPHSVIQIIYHEGAIAWVNSVLYDVKNFVEVVNVGDGPHPVLAWRSGRCNMFLGSQGFLLKTCKDEVFLWAYPNLVNQVNGLCGHYNKYMPDDFTDRYGIQHPLKRKPRYFPETWLTYDQSTPECDLKEHDHPSEDEEEEEPDECKHHEKMCRALFLDLHLKICNDFDFLLEVAIWSCVSDICFMVENDASDQEIENWKIEMTIMFKLNIEICRHTTPGAEPPSEHSEHSEHSEGEHSSCSEHGHCNHGSHFKSNMEVNIEFRNRLH